MQSTSRPWTILAGFVFAAVRVSGPAMASTTLVPSDDAVAPAEEAAATSPLRESEQWRALIDAAIERRDADLGAIRVQIGTADRASVTELERRTQIRKLDFEIEVLEMQVALLHEARAADGAPAVESVAKGEGSTSATSESVPETSLDAALESAREFRDRLIAAEQGRPDPMNPVPVSAVEGADSGASGSGEVTR